MTESVAIWNDRICYYLEWQNLLLSGMTESVAIWNDRICCHLEWQYLLLSGMTESVAIWNDRICCHLDWQNLLQKLLDLLQPDERSYGIAQWVERRTRDSKVAGWNPCRSGGRIFYFFRVNFLCWLLFRYPSHPRVTAVVRKISLSFCQTCRWQVIAKHTCILRMYEVTL